MNKKLFEPRKKPQKNLNQILGTRLLFLQLIFVIFAILLIVRLAFLTYFQYAHFATLSLKNQMKIIPLAPPRGIILDRNGRILAENRPIYVLEAIPNKVKNIEQSIQKLRQLMPTIEDDDIKRFEKERRQKRRDNPVVVKMHLSTEEVAIFASHQYQFPGFNISAQLMRHYPHQKKLAHVIGYVGRINEQELKTIDTINYQGTNFIGKQGIEKYYEDILHGKVGYQQVETDVNGRVLRTISKQPPVSGYKLTLTLDYRLQKIAYKALKGVEGSVALIDVKDGGLLALVTRPSFNPNLFITGISSKDYRELLNARERPLFHRAVRGLYPPASTVKPFMAIAGLNAGVVDEKFGIRDPGWFMLPGVSHRYRDWKRTGHGVVNVTRAVMVSCDTFFYTLGHRLGITGIASMMKNFGFGSLTGIDIPEELPGIMPDPIWKKVKKHQSWYPGDTIITSIGQGFWLASPLQLAHAVATLSQKGIGYQPHLLKTLVDEKNNQTHFQAIANPPIVLSDNQYWDIVHSAMHDVITNNEGTGYRFGRDAFYSVAGKTGTAQVFALSQNDHNKKTIITNKYLKDHSWFIAFAPVENPEVAIAVMVEHDTLASQVARQVLDAYFKIKQKESQKLPVLNSNQAPPILHLKPEAQAS
jgi:penicillin-binding protein 2